MGTIFKGPFGGSRLDKTKEDYDADKAVKKAKRKASRMSYGDPYL